MYPTCKHNHELTDDNVVIRRGRRVCKTCEHTHAARTRAKKRATKSHSLTLTDDGDGWNVAKCSCGWTSPPCPDSEIAAEFYADHVSV